MSDLEQELEKLKKENKKLSLESKLRKSMAVELDRQKELLHQATEEVEAQKEKIEGISLKLSRYLPVQLYEQIFSGSLDSRDSFLFSFLSFSSSCSRSLISISVRDSPATYLSARLCRCARRIRQSLSPEQNRVLCSLRKSLPSVQTQNDS